jgi:hypothetical protein
MATEPTPSPAAPAPPSSVSPAKPISQAQLSQELQATPPPAPKLQAPVLPQPKEQRESPPRPDFKAALKERVLNKQPADEPKVDVRPDAVKAPEPGDQPKKIVTFEAKDKKAEVKPAPVSADDAPPPTKVAEDAPVPEEQRKVLPHDKPDTARRIKAILAERDAERQAAAAARKELEDAKKAGASSEELTALKAEHEKVRDEALKLRRLHDIKSDTEFNAKYDEPVKQVDVSITDTLKKYGFGEPTLKAIEAEGGFAAFSRSSKTFTIQQPDPDDATKTIPVQKTAAQLARDWLNGMGVADAEAIKSGLGKQQLLQSEKQAAIEKEIATAKAYFENQGKTSKEQAESARVAHEKTMKEYSEWLKSAEEGTEFLKDREIPETASDGEKAKAKEYNEFNAQLRAKLRKDPTNAKEYGELKLEAAEAHHLRRTLGEKDAEIARLNEQLKLKSAAMRTTPKAGSLLRSEAKPDAAKGGIDPSDPTNFKKGLRERVLAGQRGEDE